MLPNKNDVIVVNEQDEWLGTMDKLAAHREGVLHRAFSVFVLNDRNELLIQKRAVGKYHSEGLWSNTCCSHPMPAESTLAAAHRRLKEEMGFDCRLEPLFTLRYKEAMDNGMTENEFDHIYLGRYNDAITFNKEEVSEYQYVSLDELQKRMTASPELFTAWIHLAFPRFLSSVIPSYEATAER